MPSAAQQSMLEAEVVAFVANEPTDESVEVTRPTTRQAALQMLSHCAQSIDDATELLNAAATLAATTLDLDVLLAANLPSAKSELQYRTFQRSNTHVQQLVSNSCDSSAAKSAGGFSLEAAHPIIVEDVESDRRFSDDQLMQSGARSGIVCPVQYQDRKFGAIGVFSREQRNFTKDDVLFVHSLALLLGPALAHRRAEKALADQSKFLSSAIDSLQSIVLLLTDSGKILRFNQACRELGGFTLDEAKHRTFWGTFLLPEEIALMTSVFKRLKAGEPTVNCESFLLTKQGKRRRISWSFSHLPFKSENGPSIIANGLDITDQYEALEKLDKLLGRTGPLEEQKADVNGQDDRGVSPVHESDEVSDSGGIEHRAYPRRPYLYVQPIGACRGDAIPKLADFFEVPCRDISPRGFSFISDVPPGFFELVVAFGSAPARSFLKSRVVHISPIMHEGRSCLLVGCEYIQRIEITQ